MIEDANSYRAEPASDFADRLERELLRRLAAGQAHVFSAAQPDGMVATLPTLDLDPFDAGSADVTLVEIAPRTTNRRKLVVLGAAAAISLIAGSLALYAARDDTSRTVVPARPGPASPTTVAPTPAREPVPVPGEGPLELQPVLPPEGAPPSTPEIGELVAAIAFSRMSTSAPGWGETSINLYADGRLIWLPVSNGPGELPVPGDIAEQRLTRDGAERVRSEFLASGLFDPDQPVTSDAWYFCKCIIRVSDGGVLLSTAPTDFNDEPNQVDPEVEIQVDRLIQYFTHLDSSLPEDAWADRVIRPYVPSRYTVRVYQDEGVGVIDTDGDTEGWQPVPDPATVLARRLPAPLAHLLQFAEFEKDVLGDYAELTMADARALAEGLADAGIGHRAWFPPVVYVRGGDPEGIIYIALSPLLPDGEALMPPG